MVCFLLQKTPSLGLTPSSALPLTCSLYLLSSFRGSLPHCLLLLSKTLYLSLARVNAAASSQVVSGCWERLQQCPRCSDTVTSFYCAYPHFRPVILLNPSLPVSLYISHIIFCPRIILCSSPFATI